MSEFNLFGAATTKEIRVGYISTERGFIDNVTVCEANDYAKLNPGTQFVFRTREFTKYMNINGVNLLTPDDLEPQDGCDGIEMDKECGPAAVLFSGGGGVGVKGNPIVGVDGGVMAVDLVSGGYGYKYPPIVEVKDNCGIGAGGYFRAQTGEIVETTEIYDQEEDFEDYEICIPEEDINFGQRYGPDGKELGPWEPKLYANFKEDPIRREIQQYQDFLQQGTNPWWTTRKESPLSVTSEKGTTRKVYKVTDKTFKEFHSSQGTKPSDGGWGKFMNAHAISPKPPSNVKGSDFAGIPYTFIWEEDFPYDGEYVFRGAKDNRSEFYLDGVFVSKLDNYTGALNPIKKTMKAGVHEIRIDLLNLPVKQKVIIQKQQEDDNTNHTIVYVGLNAANKPIRVVSGGKRIELKDGHGDDTNCSFNIKSGELKFSADGKTLIGPGSATIEMDWNDNPKTAGVAVEKIRVAGQTWTQTGGVGKETHVVTIDPPPLKSKVESTTSQNLETHKVFNTIDYIDKANRQLWRTNVYGRGGFVNQYGVCPFDTKLSLEDNPYAGSHRIVWNNITFPINGNYDIGVEVDDNVTLTIIGGGKEEVIKKRGFAGGVGDDASTGKTTYIRNFRKGTYQIIADLEQIPGGRFAFNKHSDGSTKQVTNVNFRVTSDAGLANKITIPGLFSIGKEHKGAQINQTFEREVESGKEYDVILSTSSWAQGDIKLRTRDAGKRLGMEEWKDNDYNDLVCTVTGGRFYNIRGNKCKFIVDSKPDKGINPMALAIDINSVFTEKEVISPKSWNENPMGVALTIDAPMPPIPQEPIPQQEGRCPQNPMWSTRFPGAQDRWWPVRFGDRWSPFLNRYALSPVPPLADDDTSGGGVLYTNKWDVEVPYSGWYKIRAEVDDMGKVFVDGEVKVDLSRESKLRSKSEKFFLGEGNHEIRIEVENYKFDTFKLIDKKIFSTADWAVRQTQSRQTGEVDVTFKITSAADFANAINIKGLFSKSKTYKGPELNSTVTSKVEIGKVYDVELTSAQSKAGVRLRAKDGSVLQMEEHTDNDWGDIECAATQGKFYDFVNGANKATCKYVVEGKLVNTGGLGGGTAKSGVKYEGPKLSTYRSSQLGPDLTPVFKDDIDYSLNLQGKTWTSTWTNVDFPTDGQYDIKCLADDVLSVKLDGIEIATANVDETVINGGPKHLQFNTTKGKRTLEATFSNILGPKYERNFKTNPVYFAFIITKKTSVSTGKTKPWNINPVGISAVLIPPPCPKKIKGKGVVTDVVVDDPGNGFPRPGGSGYPVSLRLKDINVLDTGGNYNCETDEIVIEPSYGAKLSIKGKCANFGRIPSVDILEPGLGFDRWPQIRVISPTGVNFEAVPVFEVVRDPIVADPAKLIQVTDLVGLKQTGYYQGRPYYGAVFYQDGIRYAGWYETPGQLVQIYNTLQESIDAEVTTPPSAILKQGSDVSSNDPRLDIPGTPENLT